MKPATANSVGSRGALAVREGAGVVVTAAGAGAPPAPNIRERLHDLIQLFLSST
jgi:hypothetical protein